jgi:hypothetical protein
MHHGLEARGLTSLEKRGLLVVGSCIVIALAGLWFMRSVARSVARAADNFRDLLVLT